MNSKDFRNNSSHIKNIPVKTPNKQIGNTFETDETILNNKCSDKSSLSNNFVNKATIRKPRKINDILGLQENKQISNISDINKNLSKKILLNEKNTETFNSSNVFNKERTNNSRKINTILGIKDDKCISNISNLPVKKFSHQNEMTQNEIQSFKDIRFQSTKTHSSNIMHKSKMNNSKKINYILGLQEETLNSDNSIISEKESLQQLDSNPNDICQKTQLENNHTSLNLIKKKKTDTSKKINTILGLQDTTSVSNVFNAQKIKNKCFNEVEMQNGNSFLETPDSSSKNLIMKSKKINTILGLDDKLINIKKINTILGVPSNKLQNKKKDMKRLKLSKCKSQAKSKSKKINLLNGYKAKGKYGSISLSKKTKLSGSLFKKKISVST